MTNPMIKIHDVGTGEITEREMNEKELKQYELDQLEITNQAKEEKAKAEAKAELLAKLGITEDEAKLLLG